VIGGEGVLSPMCMESVALAGACNRSVGADLATLGMILLGPAVLARSVWSGVVPGACACSQSHELPGRDPVLRLCLAGRLLVWKSVVGSLFEAPQ
jgi:hypothetical protein